MRCNNCQKIIPEVSLTCPYCKQMVDPSKPVVEFGDLNNTDYDDKFEIKSFMNVDEPTKKKAKKTFLLVGAGIIFLLFGLSIVVYMIANIAKGTPSSTLYATTTNTLFEYLLDNYTDSESLKSGTYNLQIKVNEDAYEFNGKYGLDVNNKIISLDAKMEDPRKEEGAIIIDSNLLNMDIYLRENHLYLLSEKLYNNEEYIYFPINDETGLLKTKRYDLSSLITGVQDAVAGILEKMPYSVSEETIIHRGEEVTLEKHTLLLDNANKKDLYVGFLTLLLDDTNFINEFARIEETNNEEIERILQNYITTIEYKYSGASSDKTYVSIYYKGGKVYRIEFDVQEEDKFVIQLDIGDTKYYFNYLVGDEVKYSGTLVATREEKMDLLIKKYEITFDSDKYLVDVRMNFKQSSDPSVKKKEITKFKKIKDFTDTDFDKLEKNLENYFYDASWVKDLDEIFKEKCNPELTCQCEVGAEKCSCSYRGTIIQCPVDMVKKQDTVTTTTQIGGVVTTTQSNS